MNTALSPLTLPLYKIVFHLERVRSQHFTSRPKIPVKTERDSLICKLALFFNTTPTQGTRSHLQKSVTSLRNELASRDNSTGPVVRSEI